MLIITLCVLLLNILARVIFAKKKHELILKRGSSRRQMRKRSQ